MRVTKSLIRAPLIIISLVHVYHHHKVNEFGEFGGEAKGNEP